MAKFFRKSTISIFLVLFVCLSILKMQKIEAHLWIDEVEVH